MIQKGLKQPLKLLGTLTMFNGLNVTQGNRYIKLSCEIYLTKILEGHGWLRPTHSSPLATPMNHNKKYMKELEDAKGPPDNTAHAILEKKINFPTDNL